MTIHRPADLSPNSEERAFVIATWSSSYKSSHFAGCITAEDWADVMHVQIGKIIDRPNTRTLVAVDRPNFLYGFIAGDTSGATLTPTVHYVYVKDPYRQTGIARGLFGALGVDPARPFVYSCRTPVVARLVGEAPRLGKIPLARFVPAAARYNHYQERDHEQRR